MRLCRFIVVLSIVVLVTAIGCSRPQSTPPEVTADFEALLERVDNEHPGASVAMLTDFMNENKTYSISSEVEKEIDHLRVLADDRYHEAREIAREGDFDRAEAMLKDLAIHMEGTLEGESAKQHLKFDFYLGKAQWLMVRQRWEESAEVARFLIKAEDLTREQKEQVETILDNAGHVGAAYSQAVKAQAQAACRHLVMYLEMKNAEEGRYPSRLSLSDVEEWDPVGSRSIIRTLSSIEDYQQTDRGGYSFTAVSAEKQHRIHVTDGVIGD